MCRPFCQRYLIVSCVDVQVSSLSQMFCLTENALLFTPYHLNVKKPASLFVWGCVGPVLWWETVLWSACALNIACEHKLDVWTITAFGEKKEKEKKKPPVRPGIPYLTMFCEIADTWNVVFVSWTNYLSVVLSLSPPPQKTIPQFP